MTDRRTKPADTKHRQPIAPSAWSKHHKPRNLSRSGGVLTEMGAIYRARLRGDLTQRDYRALLHGLNLILRGLLFQEQLEVMAGGGEAKGAMPFSGFAVIPPPDSSQSAKPNGADNGEDTNDPLVVDVDSTDLDES